MKGIQLKSKFSKIILIAFLTITFNACSLLSVPWITNAQRNDIVNLGDSIFALSGGIYSYLHSWAGVSFRCYPKSGGQMKGSNILTSWDVYSQYARAKSDNPTIKTIVMDGGGNDILIPIITLFDPYNCESSPLSTSCKNQINNVYTNAVNLLNNMGRDGVKNIIFMGYYHVKNGLLGSTSMNNAVDYGDTKLSQAVTNATAVANYRVFVDTRSWVNNSSDIIIDGIHPSDHGSYMCASAVWWLFSPLL
jgi:hypothetical protein